MSLNQREPGAIAASPRVCSVLAGLRSATDTTCAPELELQKVADVEMAFAVRFHDDLVATWAAQIPLLARRYRLSVESVVAITGGLAELRVRGDFVGVGRLDGGRLLAIEKASPGDRLVVLASDGVIERRPLLHWLGELLDELGGAPAEPNSFAPRLYRPLPMSHTPGRRVRHPKFGIGEVLREIGAGPTRKVQVDFRSVGLKLLQARFLEYVEE